MKMGIFSLFGLGSLIVLSFCSPSSSTTIIEDRNGDEPTLIGRWKESHRIMLIGDTTGAIIDSVDISATYEFFDDSTFTSINDEWYNKPTSGLWRFDSTETQVYLFPKATSFDAIDPSASIPDIWQVENLNSDELHVGHIHEIYFPDGSIMLTNFRQRVFFKLP